MHILVCNYKHNSSYIHNNGNNNNSSDKNIRKLGLHTWYDLIYHDITADHLTHGNKRNSEMSSSKKDEVVRCVDNIYNWNEQPNKYAHIYIYIYADTCMLICFLIYALAFLARFV